MSINVSLNTKLIAGFAVTIACMPTADRFKEGL